MLVGQRSRQVIHNYQVWALTTTRARSRAHDLWLAPLAEWLHQHQTGNPVHGSITRSLRMMLPALETDGQVRGNTGKQHTNHSSSSQPPGILLGLRCRGNYPNFQPGRSMKPKQMEYWLAGGSQQEGSPQWLPQQILFMLHHPQLQSINMPKAHMMEQSQSYDLMP